MKRPLAPDNGAEASTSGTEVGRRRASKSTSDGLSPGEGSESRRLKLELVEWMQRSDEAADTGWQILARLRRLVELECGAGRQRRFASAPERDMEVGFLHFVQTAQSLSSGRLEAEAGRLDPVWAFVGGRLAAEAAELVLNETQVRAELAKSAAACLAKVSDKDLLLADLADALNAAAEALGSEPAKRGPISLFQRLSHRPLDREVEAGSWELRQLSTASLERFAEGLCQTLAELLAHKDVLRSPAILGLFVPLLHHLRDGGWSLKFHVLRSLHILFEARPLEGTLSAVFTGFLVDQLVAFLALRPQPPKEVVLVLDALLGQVAQALRRSLQAEEETEEGDAFSSLTPEDLKAWLDELGELALDPTAGQQPPELRRGLVHLADALSRALQLFQGEELADTAAIRAPKWLRKAVEWTEVEQEALDGLGSALLRPLLGSQQETRRCLETVLQSALHITDEEAEEQKLLTKRAVVFARSLVQLSRGQWDLSDGERELLNESLVDVVEMGLGLDSVEEEPPFLVRLEALELGMELGGLVRGSGACEERLRSWEPRWVGLLLMPWLDSLQLHHALKRMPEARWLTRLSQRLTSSQRERLRLSSLRWMALPSKDAQPELRRETLVLAMSGEEGPVLWRGLDVAGSLLGRLFSADIVLSLAERHALPALRLSLAHGAEAQAGLSVLASFVCAAAKDFEIRLDEDLNPRLVCAVCRGAKSAKHHRPEIPENIVRLAEKELDAQQASSSTASQRAQSLELLRALLRHQREDGALDGLFRRSLWLMEEGEAGVTEAFGEALGAYVALDQAVHGEGAVAQLLDALGGLPLNSSADGQRERRLLSVAVSSGWAWEAVSGPCVGRLLGIAATFGGAEEVRWAMREAGSKAGLSPASPHTVYRQHIAKATKALVGFVCDEVAVECLASPGQCVEGSVERSVALALTRVAEEVLEWPGGLAAWLRLSAKHLTAWALLKASATSAVLIRVICGALDTSLYTVLADHVAHVYVLLLRKEKARLEEVVGLTEDLLAPAGPSQASQSGESERRKRLEGLVGQDLFKCVNELLLYLAEDEERTERDLASLLEDYQGQHCRFLDDKGLLLWHPFLQHRLLNILMRFQLVLGEPQPVATRLLVLRSLRLLLGRASGATVDTVRLKALSVVQSVEAGEGAEVAEELCLLWETFAKALSPPKAAAFLPHITVAIRPLLAAAKSPSNASNLLQFLFEELQAKLKQCRGEGGEVPGMQTLEDTAIMLVGLRGAEEMKLYARRLLPGHGESPDLSVLVPASLRLMAAQSQASVRLAVLQRLEEGMRAESGTLEAWVLSPQPPPVVSDLVLGLLGLLGQATPAKVRLQVGRCFGLLGAVDPGRLLLQLSAPSAPGRRPTDLRPPPIHWADFPLTGDKHSASTAVSKSRAAKDLGSSANITWTVVLLEELVEGLISVPEASKSDKISYTVQEILQRGAGIVGEGRKEPSQSPVWLRLSPLHRSLLTPLLSSKYHFSRSSQDLVNLGRASLLGHAQFGPTFSAWISNWTSFLVGKVRGLLAQQMFTALRIWMETDEGFAGNYVPHLLLQALRQPLPPKTPPPGPCAELSRREVLAALDLDSQLPPDMRRKALEMGLRCFEVLSRWVASDAAKKAPGESGRERVQHWLASIPLRSLAAAARATGSPARALRFLEQHLYGECLEKLPETVKSGKAFLHSRLSAEDLGLLEELYSELQDSDSVLGSLELIREQRPPSDAQWIMGHEASGRLTDALPFYENSDDPAHQLRLARTLLRLNQPRLALQAASAVPPSVSATDVHVEALWKLSDWSGLGQLLQAEEKKESRLSWKGCLGQVLYRIEEKDWEGAQEGLGRAEELVSQDLVGGENYAALYPVICRLHVLSEVRSVGPLVVGGGLSHGDGVLESWSRRLRLMEGRMRSREPVLEVRRTLLKLSSGGPSGWLERELSDSWAESARVARWENNLKTSRSLLVSAGRGEGLLAGAGELFLEEAKVSKAEGKVMEGIQCLRQGLSGRFLRLLPLESAKLKTEAEKLSQEDRRTLAKAQVLLGRYAYESGAESSDEIAGRFQQAAAVWPQWESAHYYYAEFLDQLLSAGPEKERERLSKVRQVVELYAETLRRGRLHAEHALPRLLTLWLDSADALQASVHSLQTKRSQPGATKAHKAACDQHIRAHHAEAEKLSAFARQQLKDIPAPALFPGFTQLISRIGIACPKSAEAVVESLGRLVAEFPDQTAWLTIGVIRSAGHQAGGSTTRLGRCQEIVKRATAHRPSAKIEHSFRELETLSKLLINFAALPLASSQSDLGRDAPDLLAFFGKARNRFLMPVEAQMEVEALVAPASEAHSPPESLSQAEGQHAHQGPSLAQPVFIAGLERAASVMKSLQKPKLISFRGSDGRLYRVMGKSGDDLRKDRRLMDFNQVVNSALRQDSEGRRRQLHVRTFSALPLGPEGGLIEWVENLTPLRLALASVHQQLNQGLSPSEIGRHAQTYNRLPTAERLARFADLREQNPPVLSAFFRENFPEAAGWLSARTAFARTAAVMSMVGWVLGLGDRHSENILLDVTNGTVFHVDFNLLFNRGEQLAVPELVPFRLTPCVVEGLGPLGVQGSFRTSAALTMGILREKASTLKTVMETFLHDPLVEWKRQRLPTAHTTSTQTGSVANGRAKEILELMVQRLEGRDLTPRKLRRWGYVAAAASQPSQGQGERRTPTFSEALARAKAASLPLNAQSLVDLLVRQAADPNTLSQMFFGWAPYL